MIRYELVKNRYQAGTLLVENFRTDCQLRSWNGADCGNGLTYSFCAENVIVSAYIE
jgi:hypothetical protein